MPQPSATSCCSWPWASSAKVDAMNAPRRQKDLFRGRDDVPSVRKGQEHRRLDAREPEARLITKSDVEPAPTLVIHRRGAPGRAGGEGAPPAARPSPSPWR